MKATTQHLCDSCEERQSNLYCMQCSGYLCLQCDQLIHQNKLTKKHQRINNAENADFQPVKCKQHNNHVTLLCAECQELICSDCYLQTHKSHQYQTLSEAFDIVKQELQYSESQIYSLTPEISHLSDIITQKQREITTSFDEIFSKTSQNFDELIALLTEKKREILSSLTSQNDKFCSNLVQKQQFLTNFKSKNNLSKTALIQCKNATLLNQEKGEIFNQKMACSIQFFLENFEKIQQGIEVDREVFKDINSIESEIQEMPEICLDLGNLQRFIEGIEGLYLAIQDVGE